MGTEHLLGGLLAEGGNLAVHVLGAMEIEAGQVARDLARQPAAAPAAAADGGARTFSGCAANALRSRYLWKPAWSFFRGIGQADRDLGILDPTAIPVYCRWTPAVQEC